MAIKSAFPLILGAGAATLFFMSKKKTDTAKTKKKSEGKENNIVMSGTRAGRQWRVRKVPSQAGFGVRYFGEIKYSDIWVTAHSSGRADPEKAKLLALERIAFEQAAGIGSDGSVWSVMPWPPQSIMPGLEQYADAEGYAAQIYHDNRWKWLMPPYVTIDDASEYAQLFLDRVSKGIVSFDELT